MPYFIAFLIVFTYTAILWVIVLAIYSAFFEPFDFGPLSTFALKSAILVGIVSASGLFLGIGGRLANLLIWWLGLILLFRRDFWESRVLVVLLWGVNFLVGLLLQAAIQGLLTSAS